MVSFSSSLLSSSFSFLFNPCRFLWLGWVYPSFFFLHLAGWHIPQGQRHDKTCGAVWIRKNTMKIQKTHSTSNISCCSTSFDTSCDLSLA